ncbi:MAG TPA: hypothetical protein VHF25_14375 [Nitriliruptorales bacterium]|nr:hypothetical protein [Nitriliruptorales bacterium]
MPLDTSQEDRLQLVTEDRRLAAAALHAVSRRLADLGPGSPGHRATRELVRYWQGKVDGLDRELSDLKTQHQGRVQVRGALRR